jgi:hypothetical protein
MVRAFLILFCALALELAILRGVGSQATSARSQSDGILDVNGALFPSSLTNDSFPATAASPQEPPPSAADIEYVDTVVGLLGAVNERKTPHVVITAHLDLSGVPPNGPNSAEVLVLTSRTRSIKVCPTPRSTTDVTFTGAVAWLVRP